MGFYEGCNSNSCPHRVSFFIAMINVNSWLDIPWYEWRYQVNISLNSIKSLERICKNWVVIKEKILKPHFSNSWHYMFCFSKYWKSKNIWIHNVVMLIKEWSCPKWMEVCHNDWNPVNNHPDNLRYDTHRENIKDSYKHWRKRIPIMKWKFWILHHKSKMVICLDTWITYGSIREASRETWLSMSYIINSCKWKKIPKKLIFNYV